MKIRAASTVAGTSALLVLLAGGANADTTVTTCGETISGKAVLEADLDCSAAPAYAVRLAEDARLDLQGFTLYGGGGDAVVCEADCKIGSSVPGGTIRDAGMSGITAFNGNLSLSSVSVVDNADRGVYVGGAFKTRVRDCTISGNGNSGLEGQQDIRVENAQIQNNGGHGITGMRVVVRDSTITDNVAGIGSREKRTLVKNCTITGNAYGGIHAEGRNGRAD